jgi:hypothetical protein
MKTSPSMLPTSLHILDFAWLTFIRAWIKGATERTKGKPVLDLVGSLIEDYEYLWDNYYFPTATL